MLTPAQAEAILCEYPAVRERYLRSVWPWPAGRAEPGVNVRSNVISDPTARAVLKGVDGGSIRLMGEYRMCFAAMTRMELAAVDRRLWRNDTWRDVAAALGTTERRARLALDRAERKFARLWRWRAREEQNESPRQVAGGVGG